jgi:outer membrane protein TolC
MFGSSPEKLEHKIKELNAIKAEYRQDLEEAEKQYKNGEMDKAQLERMRARTEEHVERINEKIRVTREKLLETR